MKKAVRVSFAAGALLLIACAAFILYIAFGGGYRLFFDSYQQSLHEIYVMESGILYNDLAFRDGRDLQIRYEFEREEYPVLLAQYGLQEIAGEGSESERAIRLMDEFSGRLYHESYYDNHVEMNALSLLEYSLDNKKQGINCRNKAQILNEMCLALGIHARKVWIMPNSVYDSDCHVVNEVWDTALEKWVMLDITNNMFWVDGDKTPLSVTEIREKIARQEFCTPVEPGDSLQNLEKSLNEHYANFLYIAKNMVYMEYCGTYTVGESEDFYLLFPENLSTDYSALISKEAVEARPF